MAAMDERQPDRLAAPALVRSAPVAAPRAARRRHRRNGPIFVFGCPRSGTTMLSLMLHAHPRIAMPPETRFLLPVYRERASFGDLRDEANRRVLAKRITAPRKSRFRDLGLDRRETIEAIVAAPPTIGSAAGTVWREFARSRGKARWGEKRPAYWEAVDVVLRLFPDAQLIHLVRDGRACFASLRQLEWWERSALTTMTTWTLAQQELNRAGRKLPPGRYHRLRYEDLLADPGRQLERLCAFLGEDFDPAMLDFGAAAADIVPDRKAWHDRTKGGLDTGRADAWRDALDPDELGLFEHVAGRALRVEGYELSGAGRRPPAAAVARYHARWAARRASLQRTRMLDAVQRGRERTPLADLG
jgi:hypothetical protein